MSSIHLLSPRYVPEAKTGIFQAISPNIHNDQIKQVNN